MISHHERILVRKLNKEGVWDGGKEKRKREESDVNGHARAA